MTPSRRRSDTDLSEAEWALLSPLLPPERPGGRHRENDLREVLNGIRYLLRTGAAWRHVPYEFPHWNLCYHWFRHWRQDGSWQRWQDLLRERVRQQLGRNRQPSAAILDSQSVKTTEKGGPERGYDGAKKIRGRKRHLLVDTQGFVLQAVVQAADIPDRDGAQNVWADVVGRFPHVGLVWRDQGYRGERLKQRMATQPLCQEMVQRPRRACWCPPGVEPPPVPAFTVLPRRWVVARSFAWLGRGRRLSKDDEELPSTGEAMLYCAMLGTLLRRSVRLTRQQHTEELCQAYAAA